jgi:hypothetical protein
MAVLRTGSILVIGSFLAACGGTPPPPKAAPPVEEAAPPPASAPAPKAEDEEKSEPEKKPDEEGPPPEPPAPEKPKSTATIAGVSISDVEDKAVVAAVQKLGWAPEKVAISGGTIGKYENFRFGIAKGGLAGRIEVVRPAKSPSGSSASMMPPKEQKKMNEGLGAVFLDETADVVVIVVVDDKPAEAKKLLDKLVKQ